MKKKIYSIGIDYGTDSIRAILVDITNGSVLCSSIKAYKRWSKGLWCNPSRSQYRQHPYDYIESLEEVLRDIAEQCPDTNLIGSLAVDATASTPCIVDKYCTPLCLSERYKDNPDAMFVLWKDHTATIEAQELTNACSNPHNNINYAKHSGGSYLPEFYWAKIIHLLNSSPELKQDAYTAVELCDWISNILAGCTITSKMILNRCCASVKMMWDEEWGGFPSSSYLEAINPNIIPILKHLPQEIRPTWEPIGTLCREWSERTGLPQDIVIGAGNIDSYAGAIGAGINDGKMILNIGTSSCYMATMPLKDRSVEELYIEGVFGQAPESILPHRYGYETGLSAFGDIFRWLENLLIYPIKYLNNQSNIKEELRDKLLNKLTEEANKIDINLDTLYATDHFNGRRCPNPDSNIRAALHGLSLSTSPAEIFYALSEAAVFATRRISSYMISNGVKIDQFICLGGIALKSPFIMQMMADATGQEILVPNSSQGCALGAAITASVASKAFPTIEKAQSIMCQSQGTIYYPDKTRYKLLTARYHRYLQIVDYMENNKN